MRAALQKLGASMYAERGHSIAQTLAITQRLIETWRTIFVARTAGRAVEALRAMSGIASGTRELAPDVSRKLRQKSLSVAQTLGVLTPDEAGKVIGRLVEQALAAASAKDLDPIVQQLRTKQELWSNARDFCPAETAELASRAMRFAALWQEYLFAKSAGSADQVRTILSTLAQPEMSLPGVPRSMLLERSFDQPMPKSGPAQAVKRFTQILAECKTLADMEGKLRDLETTAHQIENGQNALAELSAISREYRNAKTSEESVIPTVPVAQTNLFAVRELRAQLTVLALVRQFSVPSVKDDTPAAFLRRQLAATREAKDWHAMKRVLDAAGGVGVRDQVFLQSDVAALTYFVAGINFDESGVGRFAVASYIAALRMGTDLIPLEELRNRLAKLRAGNAADYEEGLKVALSGGLPSIPMPK